LPLSAALLNHGSAVDAALSGGDDYELCFTVPASRRADVALLSASLDLALSDIGYIEAGHGLRCIDAQNKVYSPPAGYQHF
jgi:thiamine-monophosphate kinase